MVGIMRALLLSAAIALFGCTKAAPAASAKPPVDEVQGHWVAESMAGDACPTSLEFFADGTVEISDGDCLLLRVDYVIERGTSPRIHIHRPGVVEPCGFGVDKDVLTVACGGAAPLIAFRRTTAASEHAGLPAIVGRWEGSGGAPKVLIISADGTANMGAGPDDHPGGVVIDDTVVPHRLRYEMRGGPKGAAVDESTLFCVYRATAATLTLRCAKSETPSSFHGPTNLSFRRKP